MAVLCHAAASPHHPQHEVNRDSGRRGSSISQATGFEPEQHNVGFVEGCDRANSSARAVWIANQAGQVHRKS